MAWVPEDHPSMTTTGLTVTTTECDYFMQNRPLNAYFKPSTGGVESGTHFWELDFKLSRGHGTVALTNENLFGPGFDFKGFIYNNNLADGSSTLLNEFGEYIVDGDKIGILLECTPDNMKVYFYHNEFPLGLAFDIPKPYPKALFPAVQFESPGEVTITVGTKIPAEKTRKPLAFTGLAGDWKLDHVTVDGHVEEKSKSWKAILEIQPAGFRKYTKKALPSTDLYHLKLQMTKKTPRATLEKQNDKWVMQANVPGSTTLVGITTDSAESEKFVLAIVAMFKDFTIGKDEIAFISTDNKKMVFKRFNVPNPTPITKNPFEE